MNLQEIIDKLASGKITPTELVLKSIETIQAKDNQINAVVHTRFEAALEESKQDYSQTVFKGIPILIKALGQNIEGMPSTAGSVLLKDVVSSSTHNFVEKLQSLGFIVLGQTNTPEFGFKNISDSKLYGHVKHPLNLKKTIGGSSGGAAAALVADYVPVVAASDGGGSIRIPAAYGGLVGFKPTRGAMPTGPNGHRGWQGASINFFITKTVADAELLFKHMHQNTIEAPFNYVSLPIQKKKLTIAYSDVSPVNSEVSNDAKKALHLLVEKLESMGHTLVNVAPVYDGMKLMESYYLVNGVETAAMIKGIKKDVRIDDIELVSWVLYQYGLKIKGYEVVDALNYWDMVSETMHQFHQTYDLFLLPTNAKPAPDFDLKYQDEALLKRMAAIETDPNPYEVVWTMFEKSLSYTPFTMLANITGQPALSLPIYTNEQGENMGVQIMGPKGSDVFILELARTIYA